MDIVKLDAISSTNLILKEYIKEKKAKHQTLITAEYQTQGRGQMHTQWESEHSKNLLFSMFLVFDNYLITDQFYLTCAVSLGIYKVLSEYEIKDLSVKWPNDIMAGDQKIAGILIENTLVQDRIKNAIIGVGLNVNQVLFPDYVPNAVSMKNITGKEFNREIILKKLIDSIIFYVDKLNAKEYGFLKHTYEEVMYKKGKSILFEDMKGKTFMARILGVSKQGKLLLEEEGIHLRLYDFKEVKFL